MFVSKHRGNLSEQDPLLAFPLSHSRHREPERRPSVAEHQTTRRVPQSSSELLRAPQGSDRAPIRTGRDGCGAQTGPPMIPGRHLIARRRSPHLQLQLLTSALLLTGSNGTKTPNPTRTGRNVRSPRRRGGEENTGKQLGPEQAPN